MRNLITGVFIVLSGFVFTQGVASTSCDQAQSICNTLPVPFPLTTGPSPNPTVPPSGSFSNPNVNPAGVNAGCLLAGELNPNWFVLNVTSNGQLEFQIGAPGGSGYYDWELWPYNPITGCTDIANNLVAPVACNWNASSLGFTGMSTGGPPAGGIAGNFQPSIPVQAGEQYILMFSNYSSQIGNVNLTFPATGASIGCTAGVPDQDICLGDTAYVDIIITGFTGVDTYSWSPTNGVSNPTGASNVAVNPVVTTNYTVYVFDNGAPYDTVDFTINVIDPPAPNAGVDQTTCLGDPIQLAGSANDPVNNTILWTEDVSGVAPPPSINYAPNNSDLNAVVTTNQLGTYLFILEESNAICGSVYDTVEIVVGELQITATSIPPTCEGFNDGQIHVTSVDAIEYSYDGGITWVPDSFYVTAMNGVYSVCGRSITGCEKCINVDVVDPPPVVVSVSNDTLICENGTAYLSASATGGTSFLFHWDFTTSTAANQIENPSVATTYTVYAENQNGCVSLPESIDVTIRPPLTGTISPFDTVCPTYSTDLTATVTGGLGMPYTFVWTTTETQTGPDNHTITVTPNSTTTYTVTVTDECESTPLIMQTDVRVAPLPVPDFTILNPIQCEPAVFDIVNTTDPTMSQYVYWLIDDQFAYLNEDTITTPEFWAGDYDIHMMVTSFEGCVDSTTFTNAINVKPKPVADFKYSPNPVTMFNTTVSFVNYSFNGYSYEWSFEEGYPATSTQTDVQVEFPDGQVGTYDIMLITTSELGCVDTMLHELIVFPEVIIYAPNAFTPDNDEHNQDWRVYMEGVDIYEFDLLIFDRWGELIWESHDLTVPWDGTYKGRNLPAGTYTWTIKTKDVLNDGKYEYNGHVNIIR